MGFQYGITKQPQCRIFFGIIPVAMDNAAVGGGGGSFRGYIYACVCVCVYGSQLGPVKLES